MSKTEKYKTQIRKIMTCLNHAKDSRKLIEKYFNDIDKENFYACIIWSIKKILEE
jgi:hypothetical protein